MELTPEQVAAVRMATMNPISVITGGPGTGKTTILKQLLKSNANRGGWYALAAPTGKAAKRIAEVTAFPASTVHRLLGAIPGDDDGDVMYEYDEVVPLPYRHVIVDESSMLDASLAAALFSAIDVQRTHVTLIGDVNQLPSVGAGYVLGDLINSEKVPVARLTQVHRAAMDSWVCRNAPNILQGSLSLDECADFKFYERKSSNIGPALGDLLAGTLPSRGITDVKLLTPQVVGPLGTDALNLVLQPRMNPLSKQTWPEDQRLHIKSRRTEVEYDIVQNDIVIQMENNYEAMVFNGEIGRVESVSKEMITVAFEDAQGDRRVYLDRNDARDSLRLAYALTIHKSQGSEWDWVVVLCHNAHKHMWTRQLLYTAVTRAKKGVIIVGNASGVEHAVSTPEPARNTLLGAFLRGWT